MAQGRGAALKRLLQHAFAADGPLAASLPGFRVRSQQLEMSEAIGAAIEATGVLVAEAGTGTGKTFAYLVPALLGGGKVIMVANRIANDIEIFFNWGAASALGVVLLVLTAIILFAAARLVRIDRLFERAP